MDARRAAVDPDEPQALDLTLRQQHPVEGIARPRLRLNGCERMALVDGHDPNAEARERIAGKVSSSGISLSLPRRRLMAISQRLAALRSGSASSSANNATTVDGGLLAPAPIGARKICVSSKSLMHQGQRTQEKIFCQRIVEVVGDELDEGVDSSLSFEFVDRRETQPLFRPVRRHLENRRPIARYDNRFAALDSRASSVSRFFASRMVTDFIIAM